MLKIKLASIIILLHFLCLPVLAAEPATNQLTLAGVIFDDANQNGVRDKDEKGMAKVAVSDGDAVVLSDKNGLYRLVANAGTNPAHFVFIVVPAGYAKTTKFFQRIKTDDDELNFGLRAAPETQRAEFSFAQITDLHIGYCLKGDAIGPEGDAEGLVQDIEQLNGIVPRPAFVVATGDLMTSGGRRREYECYAQAIKAFALPFYNVIGNHDYPLNNFEEFLGPAYYSFDYGSYHFIALNCVGDLDRQRAWLKNDLAVQNREKPLIVFQHYPPNKDLLDFLAGYNTRAVLSGHVHATRVTRQGRIANLNSPPSSVAGDDYSPRGFRLVSISGQNLTSKMCAYGKKRGLTILRPGNGAALGRNEFTVKVNVSSPSCTVAEVSYCLGTGPLQPLQCGGNRTWQTDGATASLAPGRHTLLVRAVDQAGGVWEQTSAFEVVEHELPKPKPTTDWPMFRGDAAGDGQARGIIRPPLRLAWVQATGGALILGSPVVANGTVFIGVEDKDGADSGSVQALDGATGKNLWTFKTDGSVKHTVAVGNGIVCCATVAGTIYGLEAATGREVWHYSNYTNRNPDAYCHQRFAPIIADKTVYVSDGAKLVALDLKTGAETWRGPPASAALMFSPTVAGDKVFTCRHWGPLYAVDRATGKTLWEFKSGKIAAGDPISIGYTSPAVKGGIVYVGGKGRDGHLYALDLEKGTLLWDFPMGMGWISSSPAVSEKAVYVGSPDQGLLALDPKTGKKLWGFMTGEAIFSICPGNREKNTITSSPAICDNVVYFGADDGRVYALDAVKGTELWRYDLGVPVASSPAISGNTCYIGACDGNLYAFTTD